MSIFLDLSLFGDKDTKNNKQFHGFFLNFSNLFIFYQQPDVNRWVTEDCK